MQLVEAISTQPTLLLGHAGFTAVAGPGVDQAQQAIFYVSGSSLDGVDRVCLHGWDCQLLSVAAITYERTPSVTLA